MGILQRLFIYLDRSGLVPISQSLDCSYYYKEAGFALSI